MRALTPGRASLLGQVSLLHVPCLLIHSVATHRGSPCRRFNTLPLSSTGFLLLAGLGFASVPQARHYPRPYRVRHPTDWLFTSCYSPRPIAGTQLHSVTGRRAHAWGGLAPPWHGTLAGVRTAGVPPAPL